LHQLRKAGVCSAHGKSLGEFCTYPADFNPVLSLNGKVVFVDDLNLKARALDENPEIKGIYNTPDNPVFQLLYIDVAEIETFSFAEGPQSYKL
jgi:uncharacterized pyridoxamine 5'-phosphate oxidase family protein